MASLEITTVIGCTLMCTFCPQMELRSAYGKENRSLGLGDFVNLLSKVPERVRIDFSGMAEPWLNPEATDMLAHAMSKGHQVAIYTTLQGMTESDARKVLDLISRHASQVEVVCLHLPDDQGNMRGWRESSAYNSILRMFLGHEALRQLDGFQVMTMSGDGNFHPSIAEIVGRKVKGFRGHSRAGSLTDREIEPPPTPKNEFALSCASTPFYDRNVLLPNGDVVLCCMDYNLKHVLGNLFHVNYLDLFRSQELRELIIINQQPEFSRCSICKSCDNVLPEDRYGRNAGLRAQLRESVRGRLARMRERWASKLG